MVAEVGVDSLDDDSGGDGGSCGVGVGGGIDGLGVCWWC